MCTMQDASNLETVMLLDHFRPPLSDHRGWHGFHSQWACTISAALNQQLPEGWWAEPESIFGIEVDVGVVEDADGQLWQPDDPDLAAWRPPEPNLTIDYEIDDESVEIRVLNTGYGPSLMGAIELVSPSNKDRPQSRDAFVGKCLSILNAGAGLIIVDIVTTRHADLVAQVLERLGRCEVEPSESLSISAFQVAADDSQRSTVRVWREAISLEGPLPTMPLPLRIGPTLPVDFQETYLTTCRQLRIPTSVIPSK